MSLPNYTIVDNINKENQENIEIVKNNREKSVLLSLEII